MRIVFSATSSGVFSAIDGAEFTGEDAAGGGGAGAEEAGLLLDPLLLKSHASPAGKAAMISKARVVRILSCMICT